MGLNRFIRPSFFVDILFFSARLFKTHDRRIIQRSTCLLCGRILSFFYLNEQSHICMRYSNLLTDYHQLS